MTTSIGWRGQITAGTDSRNRTPDTAAGSLFVDPDACERRALLEVLARAFRDNPMNQAIHGSSRRRRLRANRAGLRALVLDTGGGVGDGVLTRILRGERGAVLGGFIALAPGVQALPRPQLRRQAGCFWHQGVRAMERWSQVHFELGQLRPPEPHWYLAVLGVDPPLWGQGVGSLLLSELSRLAALAAPRPPDPRALAGPPPIYLESDRDESIQFYRARGFESRAARSILGVRCVALGRGFSDAGPVLCDLVRVGFREAAVASPPCDLLAREPFPGGPA